jgi:nucleotide-binding universal stress UspA family protein
MPEEYAVSAIPAKILLPIDFSTSSREAVEHAASLAEEFHAAIVLVHVVAGESNLDESKALAEKQFAASVEGLKEKGIKATTVVEVDNDIAGAILDVIEREKADWVVLSTHGTTGWHPLVFGSVAEKLVKLVHVPLLLLRSQKPASSAKVGSGRLMEWW